MVCKYWGEKEVTAYGVDSETITRALVDGHMILISSKT